VTYDSAAGGKSESFGMRREADGVWRIVNSEPFRRPPVTGEGVTVLDGVPLITSDPVGPGKKRESYIFGALEATLQYVGEKVDYDYLMGSSGCAFRLWVNSGLMTADLPDVSGSYYLGNALEAVGYRKKLETVVWQDVSAIQESIRLSIDMGVPVITHITFPFYGVVVGYDDDKFIIQHMSNATSEMEMREGHLVIIEKASELPDKMDRVMKSFVIALEEFGKTSIDYDQNYPEVGIAAYDEWIRQLRIPIINLLKDHFGELKEANPDDEWLRELDIPAIDVGHELYKGAWHETTWPYMALIDARTAAVNYLEQVAILFEGDQKASIGSLAGKFREIENTLRGNWMLMPMTTWVKSNEGTIWSPAGTVEGTLWTDEMRSKAADVLEQVKLMEIEAYGIMEDIVNGKCGQSTDS